MKTYEDIQKMLADEMIPEAMNALMDRLTAVDDRSGNRVCSPSDIKLVFALAEQFGALPDTATKVEPVEGLKVLAGFNR